MGHFSIAMLVYQRVSPSSLSILDASEKNAESLVTWICRADWVTICIYLINTLRDDQPWQKSTIYSIYSWWNPMKPSMLFNVIFNCNVSIFWRVSLKRYWRSHHRLCFNPRLKHANIYIIIINYIYIYDTYIIIENMVHLFHLLCNSYVKPHTLW